MNTENTRERRIQLIFGQYPNVDEFHFTSDDQAFFGRSDADNHAKSLANRQVETVSRSGRTVNHEAKVTDRDRYKQLFGKNPSSKWAPETIANKIAEREAELAAESGDSKTPGPDDQSDDSGDPDGNQQEKE